MPTEPTRTSDAASGRVCPHQITVNCGPCPQCNPDLPFGLVIQPPLSERTFPFEPDWLPPKDVRRRIAQAGHLLGASPAAIVEAIRKARQRG